MSQTCKSCGAAILWLRMPDTGRQMCVDSQPRLIIPGAGRDQGVDPKTHRMVRGTYVPASEAVPLNGAVIVHCPHWATCDHPEQFRQRGDRAPMRAGAHLRNDHRAQA